MSEVSDRAFGRLEGAVTALESSLEEHKISTKEFQETIAGSLESIQESLREQQLLQAEQRGSWKTAAFFLGGSSLGSAAIVTYWQKIVHFLSAGA
jgi:hypothetical protein